MTIEAGQDTDTTSIVIEGEATEVETPEIETEEQDSEVEDTTSEEPETKDPDNDEDGEVIVTIGDTPTPEDDEEQQKAPQWVKELRKTHRETQRENRELRQKLEALENPTTPTVTLGAKPKLEDFDYDAEVYEKKLSDWYEQKRKVDAQEADAKAAQEKEQEAWQAKLNNYGEKKSKLRVKDFDDAEAAVLEKFDQTQQGIVIQGAENPAVTIYALGKNSKKLNELSSIKDPVKFAFAVAKLETQLKVKNRKAPPPERTVSGTAPKSGAVDSNLERLRAEAEKSGDYSKVHQYKKQLKQKANR